MSTKTVKIIPSWRAWLPMMLLCVENDDLSLTSRRELHEEFARMAEAADKFNELQRANQAAVDVVTG
jgi:hypothetical protein